MKSLLSPLVVLAVILISLPQFVIAAPWTPAEWQDDGRLRNWVRDRNNNFIDDLIDKMTDGEIAVVVDLNNCIEIETAKGGEHELLRFLNSIGSVRQVGKYLTYIVVDKVPVDKVSDIAARPEVAMVELALSPILTGIPRRALKVEATPVHEDLETDLTGYKWPDDVDGTGIRIAILDSGIDDNDPELVGRNPNDWGVDCREPFPLCEMSNPLDAVGHGTFMAQYALGTGDRGIAPGAEFVDIAVYPTEKESYLGALTILRDKHEEWNVAVANMAFAMGLESPAEDDGMSTACQYINLLESRGIVVVAGAGLNESEDPPCVADPTACEIITAPGAAARAITVVDANHHWRVDRSDDTVDAISRGAEWVPQPADDYYSDDLKPELATPAGGGNSVATAQTSGLVALILQHVPEINPGSVKDLLVRTAELKVPDEDVNTDLSYPLNDPSWDNHWGFGETDGYRILAERDNLSQLTDVTFGTFIATDDPSPRYDSPAITTERLDQGEAIESGEADIIKVRIWNRGENDANRVKLSFGWYPFTAGIPAFQQIGSLIIDIEAGKRETFEYPWTPPILEEVGERKHGCLLVTIDYGYDSDYTNRSNVAQKNIDVVKTHSPAEFAFRVENTLPVDSTIRLVPLEKHDKWTLKLSETELVMRPEDCARTVHATVEPSDDVKPGEEVVFHITTVAIPKDGSGNKREIGGVTLKAIKEAGIGPAFLPFGYLISFAALFLMFIPIGYVLWKRK